MKKKSWLCFLIFSVIAAVPSIAQATAREYLSFLSPEQQTKLFASGEIDGFGAKPEELAIWQKSPFAPIVREVYAGKNSSIASESLFIIDRPSLATGSDMGTAVLKSFTSFSSMKGLLVYSASLKKMETFIFDSYQVNSLDDKKKLPDPVIDSAPSHCEFTVYQKEEQTGDVYSRLSFDARDGLYSVSLNNLTAMKYLFFQLVAPKDLTTLFIIVPASGKFILYGITVANTPRFFGLERMKESSFSNRMKALAGWFSGNLSREK
jgi:hypothetical protein